MKRRLVLILVVLFAILVLGVAISILHLWQSAVELRAVVEAHEVEELRQALGMGLVLSRQDLLAAGTVFASAPDESLANVQALHSTVETCFDCHHNEARTRELERIAALVDQYETQYDAFVAAGSSTDDRLELQLEAVATADRLDAHVSQLLLSTGPALRERTRTALVELGHSRRSLAATLGLTFVVAVLLSVRMVRSVTRPLAVLVDATKRLSTGELGLAVEHRETHEIGELMDAFNEMSGELKAADEQIQGHVARLARLNEALLSLHSGAAEGHLLRDLAVAIQDLVDARVWGTVVESRGIDDLFLVGLGTAESSKPAHLEGISQRTLEKAWNRRQHLIAATAADGLDWPLPPWPFETPLRNYLITWVELDGRLRGALIAANKSSGDFSREDGELLSALGHGAVEVLENQHLILQLEGQMQQLRNRPRSAGVAPWREPPDEAE